MKIKFDPENKRSTRDGYGKGLSEVGAKNKDIISLDADLAKSTKSIELQKIRPKQFFYTGICEQNMIGTAVGLTLEGKTVFASTFSIFLLRAFEIIRQAVCYAKVPVRLVGSHAGIHTGEDGGSAQALSDVSAFRTLPDMNVIVASDYEEARLATHYMAKTRKPFYMRTYRNKTPSLYKNYKFRFGKAVRLKKGSDGTIISYGVTASTSFLAAKKLEEENISVEVLNMHTIKPIDAKAVMRTAEKGPILTVEDHQVVGGLGSAVAEVLSENNLNTRFYRHGMHSFGESGKPDELYKKYGLDSNGIKKEFLKLLR